jgi:hypothetical protein
MDLQPDSPTPQWPFTVTLGGQVVGVAPLTLQLPADAAAQDLLLVSKDLMFVFSISVASGAPEIAAKDPLHCGPERAKATVTAAGGRFKALIRFSRAGNWECGASPALGVPDTKAKFAFSAEPPDGELWYPSPAGMSLYPLPKSLIVDVFYGAPIVAVVKKQGYFDCVLTILFHRSPAAPTVTVNGTTRALSLNALSDANLAGCTLRKIEP